MNAQLDPENAFEKWSQTMLENGTSAILMNTLIGYTRRRSKNTLPDGHFLVKVSRLRPNRHLPSISSLQPRETVSSMGENPATSSHPVFVRLYACAVVAADTVKPGA